MFNTLIDQLIIGNKCRIIKATNNSIRYEVGDMEITLYRDAQGEKIRAATIRPKRSTNCK